jgi:hypothetical protein
MSADNSGTPCPNYAPQLGVQISAPMDFISVLIHNAQAVPLTFTATANLGATQQFTLNGNGTHQFVFSGGNSSISFTTSDPTWKFYADYVHFTPPCPSISSMEWIVLNSTLDAKSFSENPVKLWRDIAATREHQICFRCVVRLG